MQIVHGIGENCFCYLGSGRAYRLSEFTAVAEPEESGDRRLIGLRRCGAAIRHQKILSKFDSKTGKITDRKSKTDRNNESDKKSDNCLRLTVSAD